MKIYTALVISFCAICSFANVSSSEGIILRCIKYKHEDPSTGVIYSAIKGDCDDILAGSSGDDLLIVGEGNKASGKNGNDEFVAEKNTTIDGGEGSDVVFLRNGATLKNVTLHSIEKAADETRNPVPGYQKLSADEYQRLKSE